MRAFRALFVAEFKNFFRERIAIFWMFIFPVFFMLLFGFVFGGGEGPVKLKLGVVVEGNDPAIQGMLQGLARIPVIEEVHCGALGEELAALKKRKRDGVLVFPESVVGKIARGEKVEFTVYYDASRTTTQQVLLAVLQEFLAKSEEITTGKERLFTLEAKSVQVREFRAIDYMTPGIVAMTLMQLGLFGVAGTLISWREQKILRRLWATPVSRSVFAASMITQRLTISLVQAGLILAVGASVFRVALVGERALMAGVVILGALTFISLGYMIASFVRTAESGNAILRILNFPMMFLSGIFWPVEWMPGVLKPVIYALPLTYLGDALRQVMVEATPLVPLWVDIAVLGGWTIGAAAIAVKFFRWD